MENVKKIIIKSSFSLILWTTFPDIITTSGVIIWN